MRDGPAFEVIAPGPQSTFQDLGRPGWRGYGIPLAGAMDAPALRAANILAGNPDGAAALEILYQGLKMRALRKINIAVAGADLGLTIDSRPCPPWSRLILEPGQVVYFKRRRRGLWAYLAAAGGFDAPIYLGSASVCTIARIGRPLVSGQVLKVNPAGCAELKPAVYGCPQAFAGPEKGPVHLRLVAGPQEQAFTPAGLAVLYDSIFTVRPESGRMAYRFDGPAVAHRAGADVISEPVVPGAVQVPRDGKPIVLAADSQVTGGYCKAGVVISSDLRRLAQAAPGDKVRFERADLETAAAASRGLERELDALRAQSGINRFGSQSDRAGM